MKKFIIISQFIIISSALLSISIIERDNVANAVGALTALLLCCCYSLFLLKKHLDRLTQYAQIAVLFPMTVCSIFILIKALIVLL